MPALAPAVIANALSPCLYHYHRSGEMAEIHSNLGVSRFAHDAHGRLIAAHTPQAGLQRWAFDPAGNVLPQPSAEMTTACAKESEPVPLYSAMDADGQRPESQLAHTSRWTGGRVHYYIMRTTTAPWVAIVCNTATTAAAVTCVLNLENHQSASEFRRKRTLARVQGMDVDGQPFDHHYRYDPLGRRLATEDQRWVAEVAALSTGQIPRLIQVPGVNLCRWRLSMPVTGAGYRMSTATATAPSIHSDWQALAFHSRFSA